MFNTTIENIRDAFISWANTITGRLAVLSNDGEMGRPRVPYFTIFVNNYDNPLSVKRFFNLETNKEEITSLNNLQIDINIFGNNPLQDSSKLVHSLYASNRYKDLWKVCGLLNAPSVTDLSFLETGAFKQRCLLVININASLYDEFDFDYFEDVALEIDTINPNSEQDLVVGLDNPPCNE